MPAAIVLAMVFSAACDGADAEDVGAEEASSDGTEASASASDEDEDGEEPTAADEADLSPAARLAKAAFWAEALTRDDIDTRHLSTDLEDGQLVLRVPAGHAEEPLRRLATTHLDAASIAWRIEHAAPSGDGADAEEAEADGGTTDETETRRANAPTRERIERLRSLAAATEVERDPRLEYDSAEETPAHIIRAATGDRPLTYRVRAGDSLSLIAQRTMGSGNHWHRIHELNRQLIGPDPARLVEGMELRIPQD